MLKKLCQVVKHKELCIQLSMVNEDKATPMITKRSAFKI
jgi:hypothetical protein